MDERGFVASFGGGCVGGWVGGWVGVVTWGDKSPPSFT